MQAARQTLRSRFEPTRRRCSNESTAARNCEIVIGFVKNASQPVARAERSASGRIDAVTQDRDVVGSFVRFELDRDLQPGDIRQMKIEEDQIRMFGTGQIETGLTIGCFKGLVSLRLQQVPEQFHVQRIVFNNQDAFATFRRWLR